MHHSKNNLSPPLFGNMIQVIIYQLCTNHIGYKRRSIWTTRNIILSVFWKPKMNWKNKHHSAVYPKVQLVYHHFWRYQELRIKFLPQFPKQNRFSQKQQLQLQFQLAKEWAILTKTEKCIKIKCQWLNSCDLILTLKIMHLFSVIAPQKPRNASAKMTHPMTITNIGNTNVFGSENEYWYQWIIHVFLYVNFELKVHRFILSKVTNWSANL